jgi:hypothetical protein
VWSDAKKRRPKTGWQRRNAGLSSSVNGLRHGGSGMNLVCLLCRFSHCGWLVALLHNAWQGVVEWFW